MSKKVEICGINTSALPKLTHKQTIELIKRAQNGDENAKDEFLIGNLRLVLSIMQRFSGKKKTPTIFFRSGV